MQHILIIITVYLASIFFTTILAATKFYPEVEKVYIRCYKKTKKHCRSTGDS